jgi:hypothetical protein
MKLKIPEVRMWLLFAITCLGLMYSMALSHEKVHQVIYADYGIESHIEWFSEFPDIATVTEPIYEEQCPTDCKLANEMNEAVGYHLIPIFFLLIIAFFIIIVILESFTKSIENFLKDAINILDKNGKEKER